MGGTSWKFVHFPHLKQSPQQTPPLSQIFIPSPQKIISLPSLSHNQIKKFKLSPNNLIFSCSHCSCTIFVLISYSFDTQVTLILILMDVLHSQNAVFSFEKGFNCQNNSSSSSHYPVKNPPIAKFQITLPTIIGTFHYTFWMPSFSFCVFVFHVFTQKQNYSFLVQNSIVPILVGFWGNNSSKQYQIELKF